MTQRVADPPVDEVSVLVERRRRSAHIVEAKIADLSTPLPTLQLPAGHPQMQQAVNPRRDLRGACTYDKLQTIRDRKPLAQTRQSLGVEVLLDPPRPHDGEDRIISQAGVQHFEQSRARFVRRSCFGDRCLGKGGLQAGDNRLPHHSRIALQHHCAAPLCLRVHANRVKNRIPAFRA
jgi:hypothetical protein